MKTKPTTLNQPQIFNLKRRGLETRIKNNFETVNNPAYLVESAVAIMVRNALSSEDYSGIARDTMREVFLTSDPQKLVSVRHLCVYFEEYFSQDEWNTVIGRLFKNQQEYLELTAAARSNHHLHRMLHSGSREATELMNIATVYRDANGKKHRFTIKDTDPCYSVEETTELLSIFTNLTIFEKDGVRRFTELVRYIYQSTTPVYDSEQEAEPEIQQKSEPTADIVKVLQPRIVEAQRILSHMEIVEEDGTEDSVLFIESSEYLKHNVYAGKTQEETIAYLLDGFTEVPSPEDDEIETLSRILTAFARGIKLKDAKPEFLLDDDPEDDPETDPDNDPSKNKDKNAKSADTPVKNKDKQKSKKGKEKQSTYRTQDELRKLEKQREQEQLQRKLNKKLGKSGKGGKGKGGKGKGKGKGKKR
ncbi:hypothetical protein JZO70_09800 [Enterococcus sp. 669A]|uniref:Uncharacterized protein n=1 Tax=Candidatus Enterococcus moelleringii TaxID=2815325 RepID=A0ABS3LA00_9ENTE|nr:hypothetical protein [Enterococcus sp. 669A]MBO1306455.1 hypothetical protein [Enterococcus sp. 669A]